MIAKWCDANKDLHWHWTRGEWRNQEQQIGSTIMVLLTNGVC